MTTKECDVDLNYASKVVKNYHLDRPHKSQTTHVDNIKGVHTSNT